LDKNEYTISVVIPAYNAGAYIARAIDSVLRQTHPAEEIIVVDDGSTDNTAKVVKGYCSKVKYIYQQNTGASAARNAGIEAATCEWIAFLDGDDEWLSGHLQTQTELLQRNPDLAWSTANFYRCLCGENRRSADIAPAKAKDMLAGKNYFDDYFTACTAGAGGCTDTMVIRRSALMEAGLFLVGQARFNDLDLWLRLAYRQPEIGYATAPSAVYHMDTPDSIAQGHFPVELYCEFISRHCRLAAEHGRCDAFERFASTILRRWMRAMLFDARGGDVREMMYRFDNLLPAYYKMIMRLLTAFPRTTAGGCHMISRIVRTLHLRSKVVRKPTGQRND